MNYYLGIDLGTTKVAVVICDSDGIIIESQSMKTNADVELDPQFSEQNPKKIFQALDKCISSLSENLRKDIVSIGVTGQMHGVILWNDTQTSNLITWQDKRCGTSDFLLNIERWTDQHLSSGFGSATLAWLTENKQIDFYQHASTIYDYLVACMCSLAHPVMDPTSAASWGLFDIQTCSWQKDNIEALDIPFSLYPSIVNSGSVAGKLNADFAGKWKITADIPVIVAIGDNQASLLATVKEWDKEIAMTIGTGAQVSVIMPESFVPSTNIVKAYEIRPFVNNRYIAVAAPLCGGSAFAWLIEWFSQWCKTFGIEVPEIKELYELFIQQGLMITENRLGIEPNFQGERQNPELTGNISNISLENFTPGNVANALANGIIINMKSMIPVEWIESKERIVGSGNALRYNPLLVKFAEENFGMPMTILEAREEAACGAVVLQQLNRQK
jgi:sedoheptulokinase